MFSPRMQRFLRWQRLATGLAGLSFGLILSVFSNWLSEQWAGLLPWVLGVAVISGVISFILMLRKPVGAGVVIRSPQTIRSPEEAQQYARRGFIGFVPLYTPKPGTAAAALSPEERAAGVEALDFEGLQLLESNMQPTIEAILNHGSRLEHCWLLATRSHDGGGSIRYANLLVQYLRRQGLRCEFYQGSAYAIAMDDDALILSKTYDQVQRVFEQAGRLGLTSQEIVADITTGVRSMSLGMTLACLDGDKDVEFVGTRYDERGRPAGELFPIIFSFEPLLE